MDSALGTGLQVELQESLGVTATETAAMLQACQAYSKWDLQQHAPSSLSLMLTLNSRQRVKTLVVGHPELLCVPLNAWLDFLSAYGVTSRDFFRLLSSTPDLFTRGSLFNAGNVILYLQRLGLSPRDISATLIPTCARLLLHEPEQLRAVVDFLAGLGLSAQQIKDLICRCPRALAQPVDASLAPRASYLRSLGLPPATITAILARNAALLICPSLPAAVEARLTFLERQCGLPPAAALACVVHCPELLSLPLPNLSRKWAFLTQTMGCGAAEVAAYPRYFESSLLHDIGPRYSYARDRRALAPLRGDGSSGLRLSLLLDCSDQTFALRVAPALAGSSGDGGTAAAGAGEEGGDGDRDAAEGAYEAYARYRAAWLETEGVRWSGVNAVNAGSW